jgi:hypothetical protein
MMQEQTYACAQDLLLNLLDLTLNLLDLSSNANLTWSEVCNKFT